jgi:hypothetical protein
MAIEDLNGDQIADLAVANRANSFNPTRTVSILLGKGNGTFFEAAQRDTSANVETGFQGAESIAIEDLNGDQIADLAVAGPFDVAILLGAGDGTFGAATHLATGSYPRFVVIEDLNGDQIADLVIARYDPGPDYVSVLLGIGDGTFGAAKHFTGPANLPAFSFVVAVGDLNADGKQDLATGNVPAGGSVGGVLVSGSSHVSVLRGRGDGMFDAALNFDISSGGFSHASDVAMNDLNGDGKLDLVTAGAENQTVSILLNTTTRWAGYEWLLIPIVLVGGVVVWVLVRIWIRLRLRPSLPD